jgi:hypothetical protein
MPAIFLSYRRADTSGYAGRLAEGLAKRFGPDAVFQDVETIAPGSGFASDIEVAVAQCHVLLALIGDTWLIEPDAEGGRRLDDPRDFVRLEVAAALRRGTKVLPVLLEGAEMPPESELPADLRPLVRLQAIEISDTRWDYDFERLARAVSDLAGDAPRRGRRRLLAGAAAAAVLLAGAGAWRVASRPPDVSGRWELPDGSWWIVVQDDDRVEIEEVHHKTRQVWLRGTGRIEGARIALELGFVYDKGRARGHVVIEPGGSTLRGELEITSPGGRPDGRRRLLLVRGG